MAEEPTMRELNEELIRAREERQQAVERLRRKLEEARGAKEPKRDAQAGFTLTGFIASVSALLVLTVALAVPCDVGDYTGDYEVGDHSLAAKAIRLRDQYAGS